METPRSSPDSEVPHTVADLKPHVWQRKDSRVAHISVTRWEPSGMVKEILKPKKFQVPASRATRSKADQVSGVSVDDSIFDSGSDPVFNLILKTIDA